MADAGTESAEVLAKGSAIGRYLVLGLVGRGGMGEVYAAYDPELNRKIAVKLLRGHPAGTADNASRLRLLREAQAIAKLSHPNVVVVHDVGTFNDSVFIAMEFVEGHTIGYWMHFEARPWREVLKVFLAAGRGLVAAHEAGLVHRDFKPDNVMITKDGQARVMDFGLARASVVGGSGPPPAMDDERLRQLSQKLGALFQDPNATARLDGDGEASGRTSSSDNYLNQKLTMTGALVGTPAYMAPEQFAGAATDARTDQFSYCVALYEALYGERPFAGNNVTDLMTNVVTGTVRPEVAGRDVPARVRKIVLRGLAADPAARYESLSRLLAELEADPGTKPRRWLVGLGIGATCAVAILLAAREISNNRGALCAGASARLAGAWELGGSSPRKQQIARVFAAKAKGDTTAIFASVSRLLDGYVGSWAAMYRDACEATHVHGEQSAEVLDLRMTCLGQRLASVRALTDVFTNADAAVVDHAVGAAGALPTLERCADVALLRSVVAPPSDLKVRERVEAIGADVARVRALGASGQCVAARAAGAAALAAAKSVGYLPLVASASYTQGIAVDFCMEPGQQVSLFEEAVWAATAAHDDELVVSAAGSAAGYAAERLRDATRARNWIRLAEATLQRQSGHPLLEAHTLVDRGMVDMAEGKDVANLDEQKRALEIKERVLGALHPDTAWSIGNVGVALHELGRDAEAEPFCRRALETVERLVGPENTRGATALYNWAETLLGLGRTQEARVAFERAIAIWTRAGADPFLVAAGRESLGRVDLAEHRHEDARRKLELALPAVTRDARIATETRLALAEALWVTPDERPRAVGLVREARKDLVATAAPAMAVAKLDSWLGGHAAR
jgi:serine/threonine protein kinase/tetratricopeptide (TPR) repeat protein